MYNKEKLQAVIDAYKEYFPVHWKDEMYKWEAVRHFQTHWDISADDFKGMLETALSKTYNLLAAGYYYPKAMLLEFAEEDPEAVRSAFMNLYDESKDLAERIEAFQAFAEDRKANHNPDGWKNHYQNTNAISTYLWLRYPEKYYIYKYSEYSDVSKAIESDFSPKRNSSPAYLIGGFRMYDEISSRLKEDKDLRFMLQNVLTDTCDSDEELHTLTVDLGYFVSHYYQKEPMNVEWHPVGYHPGLSVEDWSKLLRDPEVFTEGSLEIMKRMLDCGGQSTCVQLSEKYGESYNFYNSGSSNLAQRIAKKTNCNLMPRDVKNYNWWPILYVGRDTTKDERGTFLWRLRDELKEALEGMDLSHIKLYKDSGDSNTETQYWWLNANQKIWSFSEIGVGETQSYTLYNDNNRPRRIFQNFLDVKIGDKVICYETTPTKQIVALAEITQENDGERICFEKTESLAHPIDYAVLKACPELEEMEFFTNPIGSLFKLTKCEYEFIMDMIRDSNPKNAGTEDFAKYTKENFLNEVFMTEERFDTLIALLKNKKNIILQGAPGVGKTFAAKRLAYAMMGQKDESRIEFIQFHQNYSYEDFIMGYRPNENGFTLTPGIFYRFCLEAANHPKQDYFFIIDEINRGNLSKIFGELLMLIEKDYRGSKEKATLAYTGKSFSVPENLYLIGMMNTADRSLAMIDYALRRRFSFFEMEPGFNSDGFKRYQEQLANDTFNELIERIKDLNRAILADDALGAGFRIGHSYFCGQKICEEDWMKSIVYYDILPMLQEYWFDDKKTLQSWENTLTGIFQ